MSSDRSNTPNNGRPLKPTLAANTHRPARTPITPKVPANLTPSSRSTGAKSPSTVRSEPPALTPKVRQGDGPVKNALSNGNVTPRSSARKSRVDVSYSSPLQEDDTPSVARPRSRVSAVGESNGSVGGLGIDRAQTGARVSTRKTSMSERGTRRPHSPLVRSPALSHQSHESPIDESIDSRFFHANDVQKHEPTPPKQPEPKKTPAFFYADGLQEQQRPNQSPTAPSPVLSTVSERRSSGPWIRSSDPAAHPSKSPPALSPPLSAFSATSSSFFEPAATIHLRPTLPSPSKENIHLSYRKGASQIFGTRPTPAKAIHSNSDVQSVGDAGSGHEPVSTAHRKSPSLSSIDSGNSHQSRKVSATSTDVVVPTPSPLMPDPKSTTGSGMGKPQNDIPSIDTSLSAPAYHVRSPTQADFAPYSPTKSVSELATEARRERKVLDLEISNSSLLAINASLEREVRRQKAELKRFRRLSRAGRFSFSPNERAARLSEGLSTLAEEDGEVGQEGDDDAFGPPSGFTDVYDDFSDDDDDDDDDDDGESITSGGGEASSQTDERLAKDEKRLRVDLERHKELLVQSQMMNQSLKRCMYATEEMIRDGRKALEYRIRGEDVRLGGRILFGDEADGELEGGEREVGEGPEPENQRLMEAWDGEGGDRDSGIEVDKAPAPPLHLSLFEAARLVEEVSTALEDSGRPPDELDQATGRAGN